MKEAVGYITDDGKFFENVEDAEEYEAWFCLTEALHETTPVDAASILAVIVTIPNEIRRYIDANAAASKLRAGPFPNEAATRYREIQAGIGTEDNSFREDNTQAILEQPPCIDEPLPDMGSSIIKEEIRQQRALDGIGSGGTDAPDVRSSENLAIRTRTAIAKARLNSSTSHIR